jgi:TolB protein
VKSLGIYTIVATGGHPSLVIAGDAQDARWSPDGKQILCSIRHKGGNRDIWRVNADGSGAVNLTNGNGDNYNPAWSPSVSKQP